MFVSLAEWKAWSPGIDTPSKWNSFFAGQVNFDFDQLPDVNFLPPLFRRKLTPLSRMVFATVNQLADQAPLKNAPIIFASRHGELDISIDLINAEINNTPLSPAKFSFSVHNSPAGLLSIHYQNTAPTNALAAGKKTLQMSLIEAENILNEWDNCLLIYADLPLVETYKEFRDEEEFPICLVLHLNKKTPRFEINFKQNGEFAAKNLLRQLCQNFPITTVKKV